VCPIEDFQVEIFNKMLSLMVTCPFYLSQLCIPGKKKKGWGRIVKIASAHGHVASLNKTGYVSCKHGIVGFTKACGLDTAGSGVTVNAICPGYVETPLFIKQAEDRAKAQNISYEEGKAQILQVHPSKEAIKLDHLADTVAYVCSDAASGMTGTSMILDGGWTAN
jgi:3-hydroxybutyrate dehydrogenase